MFDDEARLGEPRRRDAAQHVAAERGDEEPSRAAEPAQHRERRLHRVHRLDLHVPHHVEALHRLLQRRHAEPGGAREFGARHRRHLAPPHLRVVEEDGEPVAREAHVGLDAVGAGRHGRGERVQCVLGRVVVEAAVREDEHGCNGTEPDPFLPLRSRR